MLHGDEGERINNITDWALRVFRKAYGREGFGSSSPRTGGGEGRSSEAEIRVGGESGQDHVIAAVWLRPPSSRSGRG